MDNNLLQILYVSDTGRSDGYIDSYIYSLEDGITDLLFNSEGYKEYSVFNFNYMNDYIIEVSGGKPRHEYLIDISKKDSSYLNNIYESDGKLKVLIEGGSLGLGGIYLIDAERTGIYQLQCLQRVIGINNSDNLVY